MGTHVVEEGARLTKRPVGAGVAGGYEAAALTEKGMGLLDHLRELLPAVRRVGVEGSSLGVLSGAFRLNRPNGNERVLLPRCAVGEAGREACEQVVVVQGMGGAGKPGEMMRVLRMVVAGRAGDLIEQFLRLVDPPG